MLELRKKSQEIKGSTYKTTHISDANYPRVGNMEPN